MLETNWRHDLRLSPDFIIVVFCAALNVKLLDMKYVLAVSGGIDSVALLDMAARDTAFRRRYFAGAEFPADFIVAHFDHGIRGKQSHMDATFVRRLANRYGAKFVLGRGNLGTDSSEEQARAARYHFLQRVCHDNNARLVTAHHKDDIIETVVMNLIRGTGWRGLAPMSGNIVRPLTNFYKVDLVRYVLEHNLDWVQDQTNYSPKYFRNRVRMMLDSVSVTDKDKLFELYRCQVKMRDEIEAELARLVGVNVRKVDNGFILRRYFIIMLPTGCAIEILKYLTGNNLLHDQLMNCLMFIKTAQPHKRLIYKNVRLEVNKREAVIIIG